jgi:RNA ligase
MTGWPGPVIQVQPYRTLAAALEAEPRPNAEGLVVRYLTGPLAGTQVKLKQADYVALHRIVTGFTARRLWERAAIFGVLGVHPDTMPRQLGQTLRMDVADVQAIIGAGPAWADEVRKIAPEEFTAWIDDTIATLVEQACDVISEVREVASEHEGMPRRDVAAAIAGHPRRGMIFAALDGKPIAAQAWAAIRPDAEKPYAARSEDVA